MNNPLPAIEKTPIYPYDEYLHFLGVIILLDIANPNGLSTCSIKDYVLIRTKSIFEKKFHIFYQENNQPEGYIIWENSEHSSIKCVTEVLYWGNEPLGLQELFFQIRK